MKRAGWADDLVRPLPLLAVVVLLVNDHVLKGHAPGWLTGKLSDVAGLFFFPLLLVALAQGMLVLLSRPPGRHTRSLLIVAATTSTAALFALLEVAPAVHAWWPFVVTPDPTDLFALPSVALAAWWMCRPRPAPLLLRPPAVRLAAIALAAFASAATSPAIRGADALPYWGAREPQQRTLGCAQLDAWVSKSGKTGFGLTLALRTDATVCTVDVRAAGLEVGARALPAAQLPARVELRSGERRYEYLAFAFDNDAAWRAGERRSEARIALAVDGTMGPELRIPLEQKVRRPHHAGIVGREVFTIGCARIRSEITGLGNGALALSLHLEPTRPGCVARFVGARIEPAAARLEVAPSTELAQVLPATWVLGFRGEDPAAIMTGGVHVDIEMAEGTAHSFRIVLFGGRER